MKVAIVTGAGRNIGAAIARRFVRAGYGVVIAEIDEASGVATAEGIGAVFARTDVTDEASVAACVAMTIERFGRVDVLVNNAAEANPGDTPVTSLALGDWDRMLRTNLTSVFLCVKHCAPRMRGGSIVNIASAWALWSDRDGEAYAATKGGVVALTHALAVSLGPAVRVNAISPGWIVPGDHHPSLTTEQHSQHPAGRAGRPEDVAALCAWLVSEDAAFMTGQNLVLDGGMLVRQHYV